MHEGSVEPGLAAQLRRVDAVAESTAASRTMRRTTVVQSGLENRPSGGRQLSPEQRLLEQAWEDYYSI